MKQILRVSMPNSKLRIGTRGSKLALAQAHDVRRKLCQAHGWDEDDVAINVFTTTGDAVQDRPLTEIGGKGLFTKELEEALYRHDVDIAVHSMKDVATTLPPNLAILCVLKREDPHDVLVGSYASINDLPSGAVFGTSSIRRAAQLRHLRPDINIVEFRGNVQTRLQKLEDGVAQATFLARAGLNRLGLNIGHNVPMAEMLPALAQGAVGIEAHEDDEGVRELLAPLNDVPSHMEILCERAFLRVLDGSCRTPVAGIARVIGGKVHLRAEVLRPNGSERLGINGMTDVGEAEALGQRLGEQVLERIGPEFMVG